MCQPATQLPLTAFDHDALKLTVIRNLLHARASNAPLFALGSYRPLAANGSLGDHIVAFERRLDPSQLGTSPSPAHSALASITVVPRLTHSLAPGVPPVGDVWRDTALHLPGALAGSRWRDAISGRELTFLSLASTDPASPVAVPISTILASAPVAVLLAIP
jgi:(1->4)-alpha-D-glucan 1-alpha-D-glucosylmutase